MSKEKLITQFKGKTFSSNEQVIRWLEKAIDQTREETIKEAKREVKKYVSSKKKILHFNRIIAGEEILDILNKLKK